MVERPFTSFKSAGYPLISNLSASRASLIHNGYRCFSKGGRDEVMGKASAYL